jgi:hypothetical protein
MGVLIRERTRHDYRRCRDDRCDRFACRVYREGYRDGYAAGEATGYAEGHAAGYSEGYAAGAASASNDG